MRVITPTKTNGWRYQAASRLSLVMRWFRLAMPQKGPTRPSFFENLSPNWLLLLILLINIALWALAIMVADNLHDRLCHLNQTTPIWLGQLLCR